MKKFLPLIIFILVFTAFVAGQVGWQTLTAGTPSKNETQYAAYEDLFLKGRFETVDGKKIENTKLKSPIIIYNFWASWCNPCLEEMPSLISLKKKFKDDEVQVLAFNTDEDDQLKNINKIMKKMNLKNEFNVIADKNTAIANSFKFTAIPVTIIFNRGKVVHFSNGPMDFNSPEMVEKIKKWIKG
ncbi:MAG: TlpA family protein disulfide reductase [Bacteriovorax sp.]|nr:TlpA family protein disulfide reductase [Bacteriovorax sp.]